MLYSRMQRGDLEYLREYSRDLNSLLRLMVHPDQAARPSAAKLLAHHLLNPTNHQVQVGGIHSNGCGFSGGRENGSGSKIAKMSFF